MAEVNYTAGTSSAEDEALQALDASVEIVDPKIASSSHSNGQEVDDKEEKEKESNRPSGADWKQQRLPAWQPILTADTVLPAFFLLGIALIPIGIGLLLSSNSVQEISYDYTDCKAHGSSSKCMDLIKNPRKRSKCECQINITLSEDFKAPVFFYYGLNGYYQNHRRYAKSRDDSQLTGKNPRAKAEDLSADCDPYRKDVNGRTIVPCGAIANSLFNDTFRLYYETDDHMWEPVDLVQTHIAWPTDKRYKFNNPKEWDPGMGHPPYWTKNIDDLDHTNPSNNGFDNEHLMVWMRTAALPTFRKLWARIDHDQNILWRISLPKRKYQLKIQYNYPVVFDKYNADKYIYISNTSWLGGKNPFLGYAYIVTGAICLILWVLFLILVRKYGQKPKDIVDIGPKTKYEFKKSKPVDSGDESTQPLRTTTVTFSQS
ncbi:unnamed protein product [Oppiella nova]|uniref:Cell cycle control protein 50A n=2 Tax=Oppiella nova TaxID=334625 RepID=A0A7R9LDE5_9ACAR|nr:unnamed protein product [Oppiella nova]CAG2162506.1 unnamed protein product [Oppiella nova]